jgi:hypothetical protein
LFLQLLNIARFVSLFYGYLWESLLMLDTMVVFWLWANRAARVAAAGHARA